MTYTYPDLESDPNLSRIRSKVLDSAMTDKSFIGALSEQNESDKYDLEVSFENELSAGDKTILDGIVSDSVGVAYQSKDEIMDYIYLNLNSLERARFESGIYAHPMFIDYLDEASYGDARDELQNMEDDTIITDADRVKIDGCLPDWN